MDPTHGLQLSALGNGEDISGKRSCAAGAGYCTTCCHTCVSQAESKFLKKFGWAAGKNLSGCRTLQTKSHSLFLCDRFNHLLLPQTSSEHLQLQFLHSILVHKELTSVQLLSLIFSVIPSAVILVPLWVFCFVLFFPLPDLNPQVLGSTHLTFMTIMISPAGSLWNPDSYLNSTPRTTDTDHLL